MKNFCFLLLCCAMCLPSFAAESLIWPLDIEISQSSSFAEHRGFRFHAGLDLRTQHKCGFKVYAMEDGFVSRASVQLNGYGYGLYIDYPRLNCRAVYGHLLDFCGPLKKHIDAKLKKMGTRHGINEYYSKDKFKIKKGQVIALTGESGSGPAHLHFELRTLNDEPIAPALFGFRPQDKLWPKFHSFYIEPLSHGCVINGSFLPQKYSLTKKTKSAYSLNKQPFFCGTIGLQVGISDTNGAGNRFGVEKTSLRVNSKTLIERVFHKYSYDTTNQAPLIYDYFKSQNKSAGYVYTLFKLPCETLPFSEGFAPYSGFISSSGSKKSMSLLIEAYDFGKNKIAINGSLLPISIDFSRKLEPNMFDNYEFAAPLQTAFSMVAAGKARVKQGLGADIAGTVYCRTANGELLPVKALFHNDKAELAFEKEACWQGGAWLNNRQILPPMVLINDKAQKITAENHVIAEIPQNSVHYKTFFSLKTANAAPAAEKDKNGSVLLPCSPIYELSPSNVVFDKAINLVFTPKNYKGDIKKLGIYSVSNNGKYVHLGESERKNALVLSTKTGGSFVLLKDLTPPSLKYLRKETNYHLGRVYVFKARDFGEGANLLSAKALISKIGEGGQKSYAETYPDPDKHEIYVVRPKASSKKKEKFNVELSISDYAGNVGAYSFILD